jgi:hypothetical protein
MQPGARHFIVKRSIPESRPTHCSGHPSRQALRKSRLWNAGGPAGLAALEQRRAAERQAQLRHAPREVSSGFARTRNNPDEGTGGLVVIRDEGVDVLDEFGTAPEGLTIERLFGEDREPDFDLV